MIEGLDHGLLRDVSGCIARRMGLHFPEERWSDMVFALRSACEEFGLVDLESCLKGLVDGELSPNQVQVLAGHLTVGETYFYRDPASFEALERDILPPMFAKRRGINPVLRLWSAGCCTGEEAYSLAITCARILPDLPLWKLSILATDVNPKFLAKAEAGHYSQWSFRGAPEWLIPGFFQASGKGRMTISPRIKKLVAFRLLNLALDAYPSPLNNTAGMDVILCRNVLMYFTLEHQARVIKALHDCLVDGGVLMVNPAEASAALYPMFTMENIGGVLVYRKNPPGSLKLAPSPHPTLGVLPAQNPVAAPCHASFPVAGLALPAPVQPPVPAAPVLNPQPQPPTPSLAMVSGEVGADEALSRARECANLGQLDQALAHCLKAIEASPTDVTAHFLCAVVLQELGRLEEASVRLGKVLYLDQDSIMAHQTLGAIYQRLGRPRESQRHRGVALMLLQSKERNEILPDSGGMSCGQLELSLQPKRSN